jgi:hypothetical protein
LSLLGCSKGGAWQNRNRFGFKNRFIPLLCEREYKRVQADSTYSSKSKFLILSRLIDISKELCSLAWLLLLCKLKTSELLVQQQQVKRTSDPY